MAAVSDACMHVVQGQGGVGVGNRVQLVGRGMDGNGTLEIKIPWSPLAQQCEVMHTPSLSQCVVGISK